MEILKQAFRRLCMIGVSWLFGWASISVYEHQSSSAFELSLLFGLIALFHWIWWPDYKVKTFNERL